MVQRKASGISSKLAFQHAIKLELKQKRYWIENKQRMRLTYMVFKLQKQEDGAHV
jgi:hypothetical protein